MYFVCSCLRFAIHVQGDPSILQGPDSPHNDAKCPECGGKLHRASFIDNGMLARVQFVLRELTPHEAHMALEGLGFPEERSCGEDTVRAVMQQKVVSIDAREIRGTGRTVVDSITFEDGSTVFLSGSGWGPLVHRIRKPQAVSKESP